MYFDNFLKVASVAKEELTSVLEKFSALSEKTKTNMFMSIAVDESIVPEQYRSNIIIAL